MYSYIYISIYSYIQAESKLSGGCIRFMFVAIYCAGLCFEGYLDNFSCFI